ncbi:hypothetical protein B0T16DRAFT_401651 [Cercophora newfieldiana]|uniref:Uncharacterized protein n=1 Tax=Cercophora newfieldiana TaxID=92897 RepID=A0AA40CZP1_9PEZI|nr:hypothetical protein B0T16DRAFT_401651 [Cercophora newfieldiana]
MNRHAWQTGRRALDTSRSWLSTPTTDFFHITPTLTRGRKPFSSTSTSQAENTPSSSSSTTKSGNALRPSPRERSQAAASQISQLRGLRPAPIDARSLGGAPSPSGPGLARRAPIDPSKLITMRSIRGGALRGDSFSGRGGGAFVRRDGAAGAPATGARQWGPGARRGGLRTRGRGGRKGGRDDKKKKKKEQFEDEQGKMVLTPEEQALMNQIEQGVVEDYVPKLTAKEILGYGPAVASDTRTAKVETVMHAMRMLGGARTFNSDAGVTGDTREVVTRLYHEKKPVFFNSAEEKAWMESSQKGMKIKGPKYDTKKAIIDLTVLGKYEKPGFVDAKDTIAMVTKYHGQSTSYKTSDSAKFIGKIKELLPVDTTAKAVPKQKTA